MNRAPRFRAHAYCVAAVLLLSAAGISAQDAPTRYIIHPQLSADGTLLAYYVREGNQGTVWLRDLEAGESRNITNHSGYDANPSFSPDGSKVAFTTAQGMRSNWDLALMELESGQKTILVDSPEREMHVSWSPDGRHIAFLQFVENGTNIMLIESNGEGLKSLPLKAGGKFHPKWSWDSRSITYDLDSNIYRYDLATGKEIQLTTDGRGRDLANVTGHLSPDNSHLAYAKIVGGKGNLVLLDLESGEERPLTELGDGEDAGGPYFSADGRTLVYHYSQDNRFQIRMMNVDGSDDRVVVE